MTISVFAFENNGQINAHNITRLIVYTIYHLVICNLNNLQYFASVGDFIC